MKENSENSFLPEEISISKLKLVLHALNSISECITITDMNENLLYVNKLFAATYGYSPEELIGKRIDIVRSDKNDPELIKQIHPSTKDEGWRGRLWNKRKNGSEFLIELYTTVARDENGIPVAHVGVARDLTDQLYAEEILRDTQDKFKNLFMDLKDAVYETTPDGIFVDLNPAGLELFGVKFLEELNNINAKQFYINEDERTKIMNLLEQNGYLKDYEINLKKSTGEVVTVLETSIVVRDRNEKIIAYRGILRDITAQKFNEGKLKQLIDRLEFVNNQLKISEE